MEKQTILITGAAGSIGIALTEYFLRKDYIVIGVDCNESELMSMTVKMHNQNFLPIPMLFYKLNWDHLKPDYVIHGAALKNTVFSQQYEEYYWHENVEESKAFIQKATQAGIKRLIFLSSDEANYPHNAFGRQKREIENYLMKRPEKYLYSLRFPFVLESRGSVYHIFRRQAELGSNLTVADEDSSKIATDLKEFIKAWDEFYHLPLKKGCYRLNIGQRIKILDLAKQIIRETGSASRIEFIGLRSGDEKIEKAFKEGKKVGDYVEECSNKEEK